MRRLLLFAFGLVLAGLGAISVMPALWRLDPRLIALVPAAPQFLAAAVVLAAGFLC